MRCVGRNRTLAYLLGIIVLMVLILCGCKTSWYTEQDRRFFSDSTSFSREYYAESVREMLSMERYLTTVRTNGTERHIYLYDTDKAILTDTGFHAPLLLEVVERDTATTMVKGREEMAKEDTREVEKRDTTEVRHTEIEKSSRENKGKAGTSVWLSLGAVVMFVLIVLILVCYLKRLFH